MNCFSFLALRSWMLKVRRRIKWLPPIPHHPRDRKAEESGGQVKAERVTGHKSADRMWLCDLSEPRMRCVMSAPRPRGDPWLMTRRKALFTVYYIAVLRILNTHVLVLNSIEHLRRSMHVCHSWIKFRTTFISIKRDVKELTSYNVHKPKLIII